MTADAEQLPHPLACGEPRTAGEWDHPTQRPDDLSRAVTGSTVDGRPRPQPRPAPSDASAAGQEGINPTGTDGVAAAWHNKLMRDHWAYIRRRIAHQVRHHADSEDIAQKVFLTAWIARDQLGHEFDLAWLLVAARHQVSNFRRWRGHRIRPGGGPEELPASDPRMNTGEPDSVEALLARLYLHQLYAHLAPRHAAILHAMYLLDLSTSDTAERLRIPPASVSRLKRRALAAARETAAALTTPPPTRTQRRAQRTHHDR